MPIGDWQFWLVTLMALAASALLVRSVWPRSKRGTRADLTVSARQGHNREQPPG